MFACCLFIPLFTSCTSPEQQDQQRLSAIKTFAATATRHLLDRNPETMNASMNSVFGDEFSEQARQKLMSRKLLPETGLSVMKIIQDAHDHSISNSVKVSQVLMSDKLDRTLVRVRIQGNEVVTHKGSVLKKRPFTLHMALKLRSDPNFSPQVVDVTVL